MAGEACPCTNGAGPGTAQAEHGAFYDPEFTEADTAAPSTDGSGSWMSSGPQRPRAAAAVEDGRWALAGHAR